MYEMLGPVRSAVALKHRHGFALAPKKKKKKESAGKFLKKQRICLWPLTWTWMGRMSSLKLSEDNEFMTVTHGVQIALP